MFRPIVTFLGSLGLLAAQPLALTLPDAIDRGLKNNLSVLERENSTANARVERIRTLSALLPNVDGSLSETAQKLSLASFGFKVPGVPDVIGPFGYTDLRISASQTLLDWSAMRNVRAASENVRAARLSYEDARDLVVQAVAAGYLQILSDAARLDATRAQVATAQALYERARDQHRAGVSPAIDELRSQVEWKTQQQVLLSQQNQLAKDKLTLGRAIGLPPGQVFDLADTFPFTALAELTPEEALRRAYESRADYRSTQAQVRAAELARQGALAERYPTLSVAGNYGDLGVNLAQGHNTFQVTGSLKVNIFSGGRTQADITQADTLIKQRKEELADLQRKIDLEVRSALLDLKTAADQVEVAQSNLELANQTLTQARDRFTAGVTDNIEVIQAQESVANANQSLISSTYAHSLAKVSLARAVGATETNLKQFMGAR